jgi:cytochrome b6-f complex iron-sulfur subunit
MADAKGSRKDFLRQAAGACVGLIIGPFVYAWLRGTYFGSPQVKPKGSIRVGSVESLKRGTTRTVQYGPDKVIIVRTPNSEFVALSAICTHLGCSIRFRQNQAHGELVCNCHESVFGLDGENLSGPAPLPLKAYKIQLNNNELQISDPEET